MFIFAHKPKATQQTKSAKITKPGRALSGQSRNLHSSLHLQRMIGKQAVQRLLKANADNREERSLTNASLPLQHDFSRILVYANARRKMQPKLKVNSPGDIYEQEANRVADQVMRMPVSQIQKQSLEEEELQAKAQPTQTSAVSATTEAVQRLCAECAAEEEEKVRTKPLSGPPLSAHPLIPAGPISARFEMPAARTLQRKYAECEAEERLQTQASDRTAPSPSVSPGLQRRITALRGGGLPLSASLRSFFEPRFGHDFSQVRLHTDAQATQTAQALNARAFTVGRDIVFAVGEYAPNTGSGLRLLSHELTHVLQQGGKEGPIQRIVRKTEVKNCNEDTAAASKNPVTELVLAERKAFHLLVNALKKIKSAEEQYEEAFRNFPPPTLDELKEFGDAYLIAGHLRRAFGFNPNKVGTWDKLHIIRIRLMMVLSYLDSVVFKYVCCKQGSECVKGFFGLIENCRKSDRRAYVTDKDLRRIVLCSRFWEDNPKERGLTILHEVLHLNFINFITDEPLPAIRYAFNYEKFVRLLN